jgi:hypothetical protein
MGISKLYHCHNGIMDEIHDSINLKENKTVKLEFLTLKQCVRAATEFP